MTGKGDTTIQRETVQSNLLPERNLIIPDWPVAEIVHAGCTTRHAFQGASLPPFHSFNVANHVNDNPAHVAANRQQLPFPNIAWLHQTHSTTPVQLQSAADARKTLNADASFTAAKQVTCAVMTADCLPILLCDANGGWVAAIHAGWRGLAASILETSLAAIESNINRNANNAFSKSSTLAWIGPAISQRAFEVGEDVKLAFTANNTIAKKAFQSVPGMQGKYWCNLAAIAKDKMTSAGVTQIFGGDFCTFHDHERFFSHRRDAKSAGSTGRMVSLIYLRAE